MLQSSLLSFGPGDAHVPSLAPLVAMFFLGTGCVFVGAAVAAGVAYAARRIRLAKVLGAGAAVVVAAYIALLLGAALFSRDRTLPPGARKYFCEMDCHIAYDVAAAEAIAPGRWAVILRTWFDPSTIAPFRGNGPLAPGPRTVYLVDGAGHRYEPSPGATEAWERAHGKSTPLGRDLRPGESYETTFVFELPPNARSPRLFVGDPPGGVEKALIGHENSPGHGKVYLAVPAPRAEAG